TGSVKIVRHLLVARILRRELRQTIHPELVMPIRLNGQAVEERTLRAVLAFVVLYIGIFIVGAALLAIDARVSNVSLGITDAVAGAARARRPKAWASPPRRLPRGGRSATSGPDSGSPDRWGATSRSATSRSS